MHAYLLALEIEPVEVNKVYVALPLHCTVVHWFKSNRTPAEITRVINQIALSTPPLELVSGPEDLFGKSKDVPVNRLINTENLMSLHRNLHDALKKHDIVDLEPQWTGDGFNMHVTRQRSGRFEKGRRFTANRLYLIEALLPDEFQQKKVITRLFLKGQK